MPNVAGNGTKRLMGSRKVQNSLFPSFRRKPKSCNFNKVWMPDQSLSKMPLCGAPDAIRGPA
ncbi:MAG: hypothetical protein DRG82_05555 [Deltaproteobacteria bacterium]|nr:MAG: hypothetical protein DRG82_05555 [Deltaproteobacteria bacterium]